MAKCPFSVHARIKASLQTVVCQLWWTRWDESRWATKSIDFSKMSFCPSVVICNNVAVKIEVERRRWKGLCYEWVNVKSAFGQCLVWLAERKIIIQISFKRKNLYKLPFLSQQGSGKIILFSSIQTYFDHPNNHPKFAIITSEMIIMSIASSWWSFLLLSLLMPYCKMSCRKDWSFCPVEIQIVSKEMCSTIIE